MKHWRILGLFLFGTILPSSTGVAGCLSGALVGLQDDRTAFQNLLQRSPAAFGNRSDVKSVEQKGWVDLGDGKGLVQVIERTPGLKWGSSYAPVRAAIQGDPRAFIFVAQSLAVGEYFGFFLKEDQFVTLPSVERFNRAIEQVNTLHQKASSGSPLISLKLKAGNGKIPTRTYLKWFGEEGALVVSEQDFIQVHDFSYHAPALLLPEMELDLARKQVRILTDFLDFVDLKISESGRTDLPRHPRFKMQTEATLQEVANQIDVGTGISTLMLSGQDTAEAFNYAYRQLTLDGRSPLARLSELVSRRFGEFPEVSRWLEEFSASRKSEAGVPSEWEAGIYSTPENFKHRLNEKRAQLKGAVQILKRSNQR